MGDGGWNCEQESGSTRGSFHATISVLEGLLEYEKQVGLVSGVGEARARGEDYLLHRGLIRSLTSGEVIDPRWAEFSFPTWWHYDVLRGLDYLRAAGVTPDRRVEEAIGLVEANRNASGLWPRQHVYPGEIHFDVDGAEGEPSRWNTLRALRVLRWAGRDVA